MPHVKITITAEQLEALRKRAIRNAEKSVSIKIDPTLLVHLIEHYQPPAGKSPPKGKIALSPSGLGAFLRLRFKRRARRRGSRA